MGGWAWDDTSHTCHAYARFPARTAISRNTESSARVTNILEF